MSANATTAAPKGQRKLTQGKERSDAALGHDSQNTSSPEGAKEAAELPPGWRDTTVNESIRIIDYRGRTPPFDGTVIPHLRSQNVKSGRIVWEDLAYVSESTYAAFMTRGIPQAGDILFTTEAPLGEVAPVPEQRFSVAQRIMVLRPSPEVWSPLFLMYQLMSPEVQARIRRKGTGSTVTGVASRNFKPLTLRVAPLSEQRRIVAEIEKQFTRLEAGVAALRRVQANLKRYRAAVLKAACEGRLVPTEAEIVAAASRRRAGGKQSRDGSATFETGAQLLARILTERRQNWQGRGQYKEPAAPNITNLPSLSEGWTWASIDQLAAETMIGLDRGRTQQSDDPSSRVPYIKMNNVTMDGRVVCDEMVFVPADQEESERFAVKDGDILFNTRNSKELVGKVGVIRNAPDGAIYNNNLMRIRVPRGIAPEFLCLQMCSHEFRRRMELVKKATTNVAAVYQKDLLPLAIALPPLAEQTRIVAEVERRLSVVEELESVVSANLQRATRLRQSILQKAFTGEL
jgi:type I restriction enzyme, S subunit